MSHETSLQQSFVAFQESYSEGDYDAAFTTFQAALEAYPAQAFRYFAAYNSAQLGQTIGRTENVDPVADRLNDLIAKYPTINFLCEEHDLDRLVTLRQTNIDRGLPSPVLVSQGKAASASVGRIFNSGFNLPSVMFSVVTLRVVPSWAKDYARGGACYTTHLRPFPVQVERLKRAGINRIIVHTRDPRQAIVSFVHHLDRYPEQLVEVMRTMDSLGADADVAAKAEALMRLYMAGIQWLEDWVALAGDIEILFSTFEEFVSDTDAFINRYLEFYGGPTKYFDRKAAVTEHDGVDYHFRSGRVDEWREVLPPSLAKLLTERLPEPLMEKFGWTQ